MQSAAAATSLVEGVAREPPLSDVEISCRYEDIANEGHLLMKSHDFAGARLVYQSMLLLLQSLQEPSAIMQVSTGGNYVADGRDAVGCCGVASHWQLAMAESGGRRIVLAPPPLLQR